MVHFSDDFGVIFLIFRFSVVLFMFDFSKNFSLVLFMFDFIDSFSLSLFRTFSDNLCLELLSFVFVETAIDLYIVGRFDSDI